MILSGRAIAKAIETGDITIDPFMSDCLNPASIDLHLSDQVITYFDTIEPLDSRRSHHFHEFMMPASGFLLVPGTLYLMATTEVLRTDKYVTVIDGKSSMGRLGISIHQTAGYGDPGYFGQYTLEVTCVQAVRIYPGMRFCQARFHAVEGEIDGYAGNYKANGRPVIGPKPSAAFRQFQTEGKK